jgi:hypothetical protein
VVEDLVEIWGDLFLLGTLVMETWMLAASRIVQLLVEAASR